MKIISSFLENGKCDEIESCKVTKNLWLETMLRILPTTNKIQDTKIPNIRQKIKEENFYEILVTSYTCFILLIDFVARGAVTKIPIAHVSVLTTISHWRTVIFKFWKIYQEMEWKECDITESFLRVQFCMKNFFHPHSRIIYFRSIELILLPVFLWADKHRVFDESNWLNFSTYFASRNIQHSFDISYTLTHML